MSFWDIFNFKKKEVIEEQLDQFANKITPKQIEQNKMGEGFEQLEYVRGYGNVTSSFNTFYNQYINTQYQNEIVRMQEYRKMAEYPEIADVIEDACNEAVTENDSGQVVTLEVLDKDLKENDNIMKVLSDEFDELKKPEPLELNL
jgi:hypothetical protein